MFLDPYHTQTGSRVRISAQQASDFAKRIAGDFNPIHDADARRFCVPGDLLFALVLSRFGLSQRMDFHFRSMVGDGTPLSLEESDSGQVEVKDDEGKQYLEVGRSGAENHDAAAVEAFTRCYVAFSGKNFPHVLKPLLEEQGVMFNPKRPLVIYDSMGFSLERTDLTGPTLELVDSRLEVNGKRGDVKLEFRITDRGEVVGSGSKKLVVSGLSEYDPAAMEAIVAEFYRLKAAYEGAQEA
ncbi:DUF3581 domain-containing protein [Billgrantia desiderata]|uniref:DUF3581 domain-containing protein n=1 Tax=Billgrantia desiderata TaxID=52021 RepID=A0AAW4Z1F1_9GAMM|nr:DUF3581 domain-containing protein [Halomonas desiderata]MCE8009958.1 DUF3581 domain-containing protein [Halomonas desiderata]MCE8028844.1 DUF3581 domain-containing protein [Halomonas desiderata]MCE8042210.1 DUF3581 domain-containing protein [Halomonas desiderata]MCE8046645.1 DUF3581 domain-containing protein [Halomonas desiderata]MCE8053253.1 DUF3581 domain-containing protein [Halomonas desiderata]